MLPSQVAFPSELLPPSLDGAIFRSTEEDVREFQALVHRTSGVWMTVEEASQRANALLSLTRILIGPLPEDPAPHEF